jgi:hypothetical protein
MTSQETVHLTGALEKPGVEPVTVAGTAERDRRKGI